VWGHIRIKLCARTITCHGVNPAFSASCMAPAHKDGGQRLFHQFSGHSELTD
jgi:hypothetical protein